MMYHPQTIFRCDPFWGFYRLVSEPGYREPDTVMLDSEDSTVTYTKVSSPFEGLSDIGSPGVVGPESEGLPWMLDDPYVQVVLQASPSPDYVPGPEKPEQAPPLPDFVLKPDPVDYPANRGDDGDDKDESSDDDKDHDVDIEGDEEEEHPAPADSIAIALPAINHATSAEETEPFKTDESATTPPPHPAYRVTAIMSIRDEPPTPFWSEAEIARLLAIPSPPPSPLSLWLSPLPQIPSPPLPVSSPIPISPPPLPASPTYPLGYRAAMIRMRAKVPYTSHLLPLPTPIVLLRTRASMAMMRAAAPSTYILASRSEAPPSGTPPLLPIPLPTPLPPLLLPSTDRRADVHEACLPPRKRLCFAFGLRYEVGESSSAPTARPDGDFNRDYGMSGAPATDETELGRRVTDLVMIVRQDTDEIYGRLDDAQTERQMV
ncbi:hypothetical protein Tco_0446314, partial [Tanacetum coccineum]